MRTIELSRSQQNQSFGPLKGKCCVAPGEPMSGTLFFGGAGIDGSYIKGMAGMPYHEVAYSAPLLGYQMTQQEGHFYYSVGGDTGKKRHEELAKFLYNQGLR